MSENGKEIRRRRVRWSRMGPQEVVVHTVPETEGEREFHFGEEVVVPDLAGWRRERMPVLPNVAAFELAPDWVCEVVSPSTVRLDRVRKMAVYAREKVTHLWLLDPLAQTLEVYRLEADGWFVVSTHAGAERVRAEPFDAVELDMTRWWLPTPAGEDDPADGP